MDNDNCPISFMSEILPTSNVDIGCCSMSEVLLPTSSDGRGFLDSCAPASESCLAATVDSSKLNYVASGSVGKSLNNVVNQTSKPSTAGVSRTDCTISACVETDENDSYHLLSCLLSPVLLEDVEVVDQGDTSHLAVTSAAGVVGKFSLDQIIKSAGPVHPVGPLYSPEQAVGLANLVSSSGSYNFKA